MRVSYLCFQTLMNVLYHLVHFQQLRTNKTAHRSFQMTNVVQTHVVEDENFPIICSQSLGNVAGDVSVYLSQIHTVSQSHHVGYSTLIVVNVYTLHNVFCMCYTSRMLRLFSQNKLIQYTQRSCILHTLLKLLVCLSASYLR